MGREVNRLSARKVQTLAEPGRHADGGGLYLSISANGGRRWIFLYRWQGKPTEMGLGSARAVSLAQARTAATQARELLGQGISPLEARNAAGAAQAPRVPTFGECADTLLESMSPSWRNEKHRAQWEVALGRKPATRGAGAFATPLRAKAVDGITTEDVLGILKPIWQTKPETASRLRGRIEAVLDAARAAGHRTGENPARWRGHLDKLLPRPKKLTRGHHAAMPYTDVPAFMVRLREQGGVAARALEFTILTAARTGEVIGATWGEVDLQAKVWTVPASRMKAGREHRVPLSPRAVAILEEVAALKRDGASGTAYIFPGGRQGRPLSSMAMAMLLRRLDLDVTAHGFRSSFRDWASEATHFPREIAEAALAHVVGDATERAYRRGDALEKRRQLMEAWSAYIEPNARPRVGLLVRQATA